jgi:competence protein ComGF
MADLFNAILQDVLSLVIILGFALYIIAYFMRKDIKELLSMIKEWIFGGNEDGE